MATDHASNGVRRRGSASTAAMPHDLTMEASILGGIILRNEVLAELEELEIDDLYHQPHKIVFEAMRNLEAAGKPIDIVTLENEVAKKGKLEAIGGVAFFGELALKSTIDNIRHYRDGASCN
jgi:replicative DNA helicase